MWSSSNIRKPGSSSSRRRPREDQPLDEDARPTTVGERVRLTFAEDSHEVAEDGASDEWRNRTGRRKKRRLRIRTKGSDEEEEEEAVDVIQPFVKVKQLKQDNDVYEHYKRLDKLGEGMFGKTFEVVPVTNPEIRFAMKIQKKKSKVFAAVLDPEEELLRLYKELLIMNRIIPKHKNIIEIKDMLVGPSKVFIVQELCTQLNLEDFYLVADATSGRRVFRQLVDAVHLMHQYGVVHNDLKPDNVLFADSEFMEAKIIDFGVSRYKPAWAIRVHNNFDPNRWFQDEELNPMDDAYGRHLDDVKALGRILHAIMAGKPVPWLFGEEIRIQMRTTYRPRCEQFDEAAMNLLQWMGPTPFGPERESQFPTMDQIHQHPWVTRSPTAASQSYKTKVVEDFASEFSLLEDDLTVLETLLNDWAIMPLKILNSDSELLEHYHIKSNFQRGDTPLIECCDAETEETVDRELEMKTLFRVGNDDAQDEQLTVGSLSSAAVQKLRIYNELLITLRILPTHEHIVDIRDVLVHKEFVLVVRELCGRNSLEAFFPFARNENARNIFRQVAETVRFMHTFGVVHMDLQSCHHIVFTDKQFTNCKIVDFSKARYIKQLAHCAHEHFQADRWITPELEVLYATADVQVDVRALGKILYWMMIGQWVPNPDEVNRPPKPRKALFDISAANLLSKIGPPPFGPSIGQETITMDELCLHPWLVS